jgi:hypothetical protein
LSGKPKAYPSDAFVSYTENSTNKSMGSYSWSPNNHFYLLNTEFTEDIQIRYINLSASATANITVKVRLEKHSCELIIFAYFLIFYSYLLKVVKFSFCGVTQTCLSFFANNPINSSYINSHKTVLQKWVIQVSRGSNKIDVNDKVKYPLGSLISFKIRSSDPALKFTDSFIIKPSESTMVTTYWVNDTNTGPLVYEDTYFKLRLRVHGNMYRKILSIVTNKSYLYDNTFYLTYDFGNSTGNPLDKVVSTDRKLN